MQRTEKYFENDAFRKTAPGSFWPQRRMQKRAAGASRWTARCSTPKGAVSPPTEAR